MISGVPKDWALHPQLERDTAPVGDLPLTRVLLMNDSNYPWVILVPRRPHLVELTDLDEAARVQLMAEIARVMDALKSAAACDKLNVAALGNAVPQLHVHIIARSKTDAAWPKPVWGVAPPIAYETAARERLIETLRHGLQISKL